MKGKQIVSCFDPRAVNDNHNLGKIDYNELLLDMPLTLDIVDESHFNDYDYNHPSTTRNRSLKHS